ncbi:segregation/condensation protein A [bacterium]|nr:segregation/condensation protein A [bacterium]
MDTALKSEYLVHLEQFEGPLDLLLHLVNEARVDITEIALAQVAESYFAYLERMQHLNIEIERSNQLVFAQLLELKSRLLLPDDPEELDETPWSEIFAPETDSSEENTPLVERLSLYAAARQASEWLKFRESEVLARYTRRRDGREQEFMAGGLELQVSLEALAGTYRRLCKAGRFLDNPVTLQRVEISVPERMGQLQKYLREHRNVRFSQLFEEKPSAAFIVVTFLSLLEMVKQHKVRLKQAQTVGEIEVSFL